MLSIPEQKTFGVDAKLHRITGKPIEQGHGALPEDAQAVSQWGEMLYSLAELSNHRRECKDKHADEAVTLANMGATQAALRGDDITGRQNSLHRLAAQDLLVSNSRDRAPHSTPTMRRWRCGSPRCAQNLWKKASSTNSAMAPRPHGVLKSKTSGWSVPTT